MQYEFEWFDRTLGAPTVTIAQYGLIFNTSAIMGLGEPERIMLGFDNEQLIIAVKPISDQAISESTTFPFRGRIRRGFVRINCKDFVRYIRQYFLQPFTKSWRCVARWDATYHALLVDLRQEQGEPTPEGTASD